MKMSDGVEWAVHCCTFLAALPNESALSGARLSEFFALPKDYLAKHLQALSRAGLVETSKGPKGGYRLARPPAEISLLDVVEAIDGKNPCFQCTEIRRQGPSGQPDRHYKKPCGIAAAMWKAESVWRKELKKVDLGSLVHEAELNVSTLQQESAYDWLCKALG